MIGTIEYMIITLAKYDLSSLTELDELCDNSVQHARHNSDKTKCILKYTTKGKSIPTCISTKTRYNKTELFEIVKHKEWL